MARSCTLDPLEKFRFLVDFSIPGGAAAVRTGFHDVQMPKRATNKISYREGKDPDISGISAGLSTMEDIVMSRGAIGSDGAAANDFLQWIKTVMPQTSGSPGVDPGSASYGELLYRAEVDVKLLDRAGQVVRHWRLYNAFPVNFVPGSDLNSAEDGEKSMESLTLAYEDFQELKIASPSPTAAGTEAL